MKLPPPVSLCLFLTPVVASLPCVHIQVGGQSHSLSLYGVMAGMAPYTGARGWLPYLVLLLAIGTGVRLAQSEVPARRVRRLACGATGAAIVAVLDLGWPAFLGVHRARSLITDSVQIEAAAGLWLLLLLQIVAFVIACRLPRATSVDAAAQGPRKS